MRAVDCSGEGMATSNGNLASVLDRLVDVSNRDNLSAPEFNRLRSLARRMTNRLAKQGDANPQIIHAVDQASTRIASLDPAQIGTNRAVIEAMRAMFRLRRATSESLRERQSERPRRRVRDNAAAIRLPVELPTSVDLRSATTMADHWEQIGPNTVDAISACVRDVRRWSKSSSDIEPSQVILHYGDRIIAGTAPIKPSASLPNPTTGAVRGKAFTPRGDAWVVALEDASIAADSVAAVESTADRGGTPPITPDLHLTNPSDAPILQQLKATLLAGHPFAFLFLASPPFTTNARNAAGAGVAGPANLAQGRAQTATAVGYDDDAQAFIIVEPSQDGARSGGGSLFLSYAYVTNPVLAQDVWTIRSMKPAAARNAAA